MAQFLPREVSDFCFDNGVIEGSLKLGMIVIVSLTTDGRIAEIDSAHMNVRQAYDAIRISCDDSFGVILPGEKTWRFMERHEVQAISFEAFRTEAHGEY